MNTPLIGERWREVKHGFKCSIERLDYSMDKKRTIVVALFDHDPYKSSIGSYLIEDFLESFEREKCPENDIIKIRYLHEKMKEII